MLNYCRLCLKKETLLTNLITSELKYSHLNMIEFLYWIFDVEVNVSDPFSKSICQRCTNVIQDIERYREAFKKTQLILRNKIDELGSICTKRINKVFDETLPEIGIKSLPSKTKTKKISIPITRLENSPILKHYDKISDFCYKKKQTINEDSNDSPTRCSDIESSVGEIDNVTVKVPMRVFQTCICPSVSISRIEDTSIYKEYEQIDNTTYKKIPHKFDISPNLMQAEIKRMKFIEYYYRTPTTALQELIRNKYERITHNINVTQRPQESDISEPLIKIHGVRHVQVCDYCSKSFTSKKLLIIHNKRQHKQIFRRDVPESKLAGKMKDKKKSLHSLNVKTTTTNVPPKISDSIDNNLQHNEFLTKLKCNWDNISDLINIYRRKESIEPDYDKFPNLQFIREESTNSKQSKNEDPNVSQSVHKADENIATNLECKKKPIENDTDIVSTSLPHAESTENKKKHISVIQHIVIPNKELEQNRANLEKNHSPRDSQNFVFDEEQSNENIIVPSQQNTLSENMKHNENSTSKDVDSVSKESEEEQYLSQKHNLHSRDIAKHLWEKTIKDIRIIQESESEDQDNRKQMKSSELMFCDQQHIEKGAEYPPQTDRVSKTIIHNVNCMSKGEILVNGDKNLQCKFPSSSHTLESEIKKKALHNVKHIQQNKSKHEQPQEGQEYMPNLVIDKEQNNKNKTLPLIVAQGMENEDHTKEIEGCVDEEENIVFFFNRKGELDKSIQHDISKVQENKDKIETKTNGLQSVLMKKKVINKLKQYMQTNRVEEEFDSEETVSRDATVTNVNLLAKETEIPVDLLESTNQSEFSEREKEDNITKTVEAKNNSVPVQALKINDKISASRVKTKNMQNNSQCSVRKKSILHNAKKHKRSIWYRTRIPRRYTTQSDEIGYELIDNKNAKNQLNNASNCKRYKSKNSPNECKKTVDLSEESRHYKSISNVHDEQLLVGVPTVTKTCTEFNNAKEYKHHSKTKPNSKSCKRKNQLRRNSHTSCPHMEKRVIELSSLFERIGITNDSPLGNNATVIDDHNYTTNIDDQCSCGKSSPAKKLRLTPMASSIPLSGHVETMKKLCKPCIVVAKKLDIRKEIPRLSVCLEQDT